MKNRSSFVSNSSSTSFILQPFHKETTHEVAYKILELIRDGTLHPIDEENKKKINKKLKELKKFKNKDTPMQFDDFWMQEENPTEIFRCSFDKDLICVNTSQNYDWENLDIPFFRIFDDESYNEDPEEFKNDIDRYFSGRKKTLDFDKIDRWQIEKISDEVSLHVLLSVMDFLRKKYGKDCVLQAHEKVCEAVVYGLSTVTSYVESYNFLYSCDDDSLEYKKLIGKLNGMRWAISEFEDAKKSIQPEDKSVIDAYTFVTEYISEKCNELETYLNDYREHCESMHFEDKNQAEQHITNDGDDIDSILQRYSNLFAETFEAVQEYFEELESFEKPLTNIEIYNRNFDEVLSFKKEIEDYGFFVSILLNKSVESDKLFFGSLNVSRFKTLVEVAEKFSFNDSVADLSGFLTGYELSGVFDYCKNKNVSLIKETRQDKKNREIEEAKALLNEKRENK